MNKIPENIIITHYLSYVFFGVAVCSAVWQIGDPYVAIFVLGSIPFILLSVHLRPSSMIEEARFIAQTAIIAVSILWLSFRIASGVTADKSIMETLCLIGLALGITIQKGFYMYQMLLSVILTIVGSVFPRNFFVYLLPLIFLLGMLVLYYSRLSALSSQPFISVELNVLRKKNWGYFLTHAGLVFGLWIFFFTFYPSPSELGLGFIPSSSTNSNHLPPQYEKWFSTPYLLGDEEGYLTDTETEKQKAPVPDNSPSSTSQNILDAFPSTQEGSGSGQPGNDIVMLVSCPIKSYWTAMLYDIYDGYKWYSSKEMKSQKIKMNEFMHSLPSLFQTFTIMKWNSKILVSAYRPEFFYFKQFYMPGSVSTFFNCSMSRYMPLPFIYNVYSKVPQDPQNLPFALRIKQKNTWDEKLKPSHYKKLPEKLISSRLSRLVSEICHDTEDPMKKGILLRDYLRNNCSYKQFSQPIPAEKECADYFIFELKEGNCQHFASSLAVLARLADIPARVATGYSPGDYNSLTGLFEVREYHAHAWCQLFVNEYGWLTFDATPPGNVPSVTTPLLLGSFQDPFGDEWRIKPPELTEHTLKHFRKSGSNMTAVRSPESDFRVRSLHRIVTSIPLDSDELRTALKKIPENENYTSRFGKWFELLKKNSSTMYKKTIESLMASLDFITSPFGFALSLLIISCFILFFLQPEIKKYSEKKRRKIFCLHKLAILGKSPDRNPDFCVDCCYKLTRELLELAGMPRLNNVELFEYGAALTKVDPQLGRDALFVFFSYSKMKFGEIPSSPEYASIIYSRTVNLKDRLHLKFGKI